MATCRGDFVIMKWLREIGCPWSEYLFEKAVNHGNLEMLKWLKEEVCPWSKLVFDNVAINGDINILFWLKEEGFPWDHDVYVLIQAISGGADILTKMSHGQRILFRAAVRRGDLVILKWFRKEGCPWSAKCMNTALIHKNVEIAEWLHREGCPWDEGTRMMFLETFKKHCQSK